MQVQVPIFVDGTPVNNKSNKQQKGWKNYWKGLRHNLPSTSGLGSNSRDSGMQKQETNFNRPKRRVAWRVSEQITALVTKITKESESNKSYTAIRTLAAL